MIKFKDNAEINSEINDYVKKISYNPYTGELWDIESINVLNRQELAKEFANNFFYDKDFDIINGKENYEDFILYVAKQIDRLIPRFFFMENHGDLSEKYTSLLTKRIFTTYGKDGFEETEHFIYHYDQDFSQEDEYIKKTSATKAQIELLKKLSIEQGYQLINIEYLNKNQANSIIKYFNGETDDEPIVFDFFTIAI
jgi:hypothetical protein